ncbi:MAG: hypothetical protein AAF752_06955 [Bacteroidota bacterium]
MLRISLAVGLLVLAGCSRPPVPSEAERASADSAFVWLSELDREPLDTAFGRLHQLGYTETQTVTRFGEDGAPADSFRAVTQFSGEAGTRTADVHVAFASDGFAPDTDDTETTLDLSDFLADEPAFLSERGQENYLYTRAPDSTLGNRQLLVFDVQARPETSGAVKVQHARLFIDTETRTLAGFDIRREDTSFLFDEIARYRFGLQPTLDAGWLPAHFEATTLADGLFVPATHARVELRFARSRSDEG